MEQEALSKVDALIQSLVIDFKSYFEEHESTFEPLNQSFQNAISRELSKQPLGPFKIEVEKIYRAIFKSQKSIHQLSDKYSDAFHEFKNNLLFTQQAMSILMKDKLMLSKLNAEIGLNRQYLKEQAHQEERFKNEITDAKRNIENLQAAIKQGVCLSSEQETHLKALIHAKEQVNTEAEEELKKVFLLRSQLNSVSERIQNTETESRVIETEAYDLQLKVAAKQQEVETETRNKEKSEKEMRSLRSIVSTKQQEVKTKQDSFVRLSEEIAHLKVHIEGQSQLLQQFEAEKELVTARIYKLTEESKDQFDASNALEEENNMCAKILRDKKLRLSTKKQEVKRLIKVKEEIGRRIQIIEKDKAHCELERKHITDQIEHSEMEVANLKRHLDYQKKMIDDMSRERDIVARSIQKSQNESFKHATVISSLQKRRKNMEFDLRRHQREIIQSQERIRQLKVDRERILKESTRFQEQNVELVRTMKEKELDVYDLKKRLIQVETKLKHQQALFEAVQSDRNIHSKRLVESQNEILEMKRRLKLMHFQVNSFKDDIRVKDEEIARCKEENAKLLKDIDTIQQDIDSAKHQIELSTAYIRKQITEEMKLIQFVKAAELERTRQDHSLHILYGERDNLSIQITRNQEELVKLYEKMKILQSMEFQEAKEYQHQLTIFNGLQDELLQVRKRKNVLKATIDLLPVLKRTMHQYENDLLMQQVKMSALRQEMENPLNIHRWRKLESTDPKAFEMIQLIHALQKKLVIRGEELKELDHLIQKKEQTYLQLKVVSAKQVGPEAIEQIQHFKELLDANRSQLKKMTLETKVLRAQISEHEHYSQLASENIRTTKAKFLRQKLVEFKDKLTVKMDDLPPLPAKILNHL